MAALGGGIGASGKLGVGGRDWHSVAARSMVASTVTQGVGVALGMQSKFSWAGVAAAGVSAGVITQIGQAEWFRGMESVTAQRVITGTAGAAANAATRSLLEGTDFGDNLIAALPDVIGQTIGSMVADGIADKLEQARAEKSRSTNEAFTLRAEGEDGGLFIRTSLDGDGLRPSSGSSVRDDYLFAPNNRLGLPDDYSNGGDTREDAMSLIGHLFNEDGVLDLTPGQYRELLGRWYPWIGERASTRDLLSVSMNYELEGPRDFERLLWQFQTGQSHPWDTGLDQFYRPGQTFAQGAYDQYIDSFITQTDGTAFSDAQIVLSEGHPFKEVEIVVFSAIDPPTTDAIELFGGGLGVRLAYNAITKAKPAEFLVDMLLAGHDTIAPDSAVDVNWSTRDRWGERHAGRGIVAFNHGAHTANRGIILPLGGATTINVASLRGDVLFYVNYYTEYRNVYETRRDD